jgi:DNA-binding XRE family transcriptional regulator
MTSESPLAIARRAAGFATQADAAAAAGVAQSTWADLESGRRPDWRLSTWRTIARVIGARRTVALFRDSLAGP